MSCPACVSLGDGFVCLSCVRLVPATPGPPPCPHCGPEGRLAVALREYDAARAEYESSTSEHTTARPGRARDALIAAVRAAVEGGR
jgi:hypothetical protein